MIFTKNRGFIWIYEVIDEGAKLNHCMDRPNQYWIFNKE